jgi:uncharacterized SAM-binding protein YcdF (DUF218 family)
MMFDILKHALQPASITLLLMLLALGVVLLYGRANRARWGRRLLTVMTIVYWLLSCPAGAAILARTLADGYGPLASPEEAPKVQAVVMLGAGSRTVSAAGGRWTMVTHPSALRVLETVRVYRLLGDPLVIVSGGYTDTDVPTTPESEAMRAAVIALGVPPARVIVETKSANTHDAAVVVKQMFADRGISRFVLVTSPVHMPRSLESFAAQGLHPVPSASPLYGDRARARFPLLPDDGAFEIGNAVIYEWCARAYYRLRGWV